MRSDTSTRATTLSSRTWAARAARALLADVPTRTADPMGSYGLMAVSAGLPAWTRGDAGMLAATATRCPSSETSRRRCVGPQAESATRATRRKGRREVTRVGEIAGTV